MKKTYKNWFEYWNEVSIGLDKHIEASRNPQAEKYIICSLGLFSFITEELPDKCKKHKEIVQHLYPLIIELHDILRSTLLTQSHLLTATSAFNLRSAFEITSNLTYIYCHATPSIMCERLNAFYRYEQLIGAKYSPNLKAEPELIEREFATKHPYWSKKDGLLKEGADWTGEDLSFKKITEKIGKSKDYYQIYKLTSKFLHGSPIVINLYRSKFGTSCVTDPKHSTMFNLMCAHAIMEGLKEFCNFFEIEFPMHDYSLVQLEMVKVEATLNEA